MRRLSCSRCAQDAHQRAHQAALGARPQLVALLSEAVRAAGQQDVEIVVRARLGQQALEHQRVLRLPNVQRHLLGRQDAPEKRQSGMSGTCRARARPPSRWRPRRRWATCQTFRSGQLRVALLVAAAGQVAAAAGRAAQAARHHAWRTGGARARQKGTRKSRAFFRRGRGHAMTIMSRARFSLRPRTSRVAHRTFSLRNRRFTSAHALSRPSSSSAGEGQPRPPAHPSGRMPAGKPQS